MGEIERRRQEVKAIAEDESGRRRCGRTTSMFLSGKDERGILEYKVSYLVYSFS